jgi:hypothetical protein
MDHREYSAYLCGVITYKLLLPAFEGKVFIPFFAVISKSNYDHQRTLIYAKNEGEGCE